MRSEPRTLIGATVNHPVFGTGQVIQVDKDEQSLIQVSFSDKSRKFSPATFDNHCKVIALQPASTPIATEGKKSVRVSNAESRFFFEKVVSAYSLRFFPDRDEYVEDQRFPDMVPIYQRLVKAGKGLPPTQDCFVEAVLREMHLKPDRQSQAIVARLHRAYPPMVHQHHFLLLMRESFESAEWDIDLDLQYGIDIVVSLDGQRFGIRLSVDTARADFYKRRKQSRYPVAPFRVIDAVIQRENYKKGRFWFYDPADVHLLKDAMIRLSARRAAV